MNTLNDFVSVPIPSALYQAVAERFPYRVGTVIENVISEFLDRTSQNLEILGKRNEQGVFWGNLFLPSSTEFRVRHFGEYKYAKLDGESLNYDGTVYLSVAKMANAMRKNTNVNARRYVDIKRPGDNTWISAFRLFRGK